MRASYNYNRVVYSSVTWLHWHQNKTRRRRRRCSAMEALRANIAATCPPAFAGVAGEMFARAVTAVIATHCAILDDNVWPKDNSADVVERVADGSVIYDFIIIGAGTAGSIIATRLTQNFPLRSVLLIEAGDDPGLDYQIPLVMFNKNNASMISEYQTDPDGHSCLGFKNKSCIWNKGRGMGGSSTINAMIYTRGHPKDYDNWAKEGNLGWSYRDLTPYFQKIENKLKLRNYKYHENPLYTVLEEVWKGIHYYPSKNDKNEGLIGTQRTRLLINKGKRLNTAKEYFKESKNLHVMKNSLVLKVLVDPETKSAIGVEAQLANGSVVRINVSKEVILSAGTIVTPQILMLSGIGPTKTLIKHDIERITNLPVGENLQDHITFPVFLKTNNQIKLDQDSITKYIMEYMMEKRGPFATIGTVDFMCFINTKNNSDHPNVQFHNTYFTMNDSFLINSYYEGLGYTEEIVQEIITLNKKNDILVLYPTLLHPKSIGKIIISDKDAKKKPIIKTNYLNDKNDLDTLLEAIEVIHKLQDTPFCKSLGIRIAKLRLQDCSKFKFDSKFYWECYIKHIATTLYHAAGTAKMGREIENSVVNSNLLVHGMKNLRVVDASIMPSVTGGNIMAPTMAIAEKAADIIKNHYVRDEL